MNKYYVLLDAAEVQGHFKLDEYNSFSDFITTNTNPDILIYPDGEFLYSRIKSFNNFKPRYIKDMGFYEDLSLGRVLSSKELLEMNRQLKLLAELFYNFKKINCLADCEEVKNKIISSEALINYFFETFEDFDGKVIRRVNHFIRYNEVDIYLVRVDNINEDIMKKILNKDNSYIYTGSSFVP